MAGKKRKATPRRYQAGVSLDSQLAQARKENAKKRQQLDPNKSFKKQIVARAKKLRDHPSWEKVRRQLDKGKKLSDRKLSLYLAAGGVTWGTLVVAHQVQVVRGMRRLQRIQDAPGQIGPDGGEDVSHHYFGGEEEEEAGEATYGDLVLTDDEEQFLENDMLDLGELEDRFKSLGGTLFGEEEPALTLFDKKGNVIHQEFKKPPVQGPKRIPPRLPKRPTAPTPRWKQIHEEPKRVTFTPYKEPDKKSYDFDPSKPGDVKEIIEKGKAEVMDHIATVDLDPSKPEQLREIIRRAKAGAQAHGGEMDYKHDTEHVPIEEPGGESEIQKWADNPPTAYPPETVEAVTPPDFDNIDTKYLDPNKPDQLQEIIRRQNIKHSSGSLPDFGDEDVAPPVAEGGVAPPVVEGGVVPPVADEGYGFTSISFDPADDVVPTVEYNTAWLKDLKRSGKMSTVIEELGLKEGASAEEVLDAVEKLGSAKSVMQRAATYPAKMLESMVEKGGFTGKLATYIMENGKAIQGGFLLAGNAIAVGSSIFEGVKLSELHKAKNAMKQYTIDHPEDKMAKEFLERQEAGVKRHDAYFGVNTGLTTAGVATGIAAGMAEAGYGGALATGLASTGPVGWVLLGLGATAMATIAIVEDESQKKEYKDYLQKHFAHKDLSEVAGFGRLAKDSPELAQYVNGFLSHEVPFNANFAEREWWRTRKEWFRSYLHKGALMPYKIVQKSYRERAKIWLDSTKGMSYEEKQKSLKAWQTTGNFGLTPEPDKYVQTEEMWAATLKRVRGFASKWPPEMI